VAPDPLRAGDRCKRGRGRGEWDAAPPLKPGALQVAPRLRARLLVSEMPRPDQITRPFRLGALSLHAAPEFFV
jgi:hypothetical protein